MYVQILPLNWAWSGKLIVKTAGRMPQIVGWGAGVSIVLSALNITGGSLAGKVKHERPDVIDEYERKEYLRKNRRRPLVETIAEVGEGRGKFMTEQRRLDSRRLVAY